MTFFSGNRGLAYPFLGIILMLKVPPRLESHPIGRQRVSNHLHPLCAPLKTDDFHRYLPVSSLSPIHHPALKPNALARSGIPPIFFWVFSQCPNLASQKSKSSLDMRVLVLVFLPVVPSLVALAHVSVSDVIALKSGVPRAMD